MTIREYLLDCLMEEAAEVAVAVSKAQRFGDDESDSEPFTDEASGFHVRTGNNIEVIEKEYNDLVAVLELLDQECGIKVRLRPELMQRKLHKLRAAMKYSNTRGVLQDYD